MLDGFDLGVGILSLTSSDEERRSILMTSLGNIWDANETWLVVGWCLIWRIPIGLWDNFDCAIYADLHHDFRVDFSSGSV
jgi:Cytochrome bd terminal oxidase subunit II